MPYLLSWLHFFFVGFFFEKKQMRPPAGEDKTQVMFQSIITVFPPCVTPCSFRQSPPFPDSTYPPHHHIPTLLAPDEGADLLCLDDGQLPFLPIKGNSLKGIKGGVRSSKNSDYSGSGTDTDGGKEIRAIARAPPNIPQNPTMRQRRAQRSLLRRGSLKHNSHHPPDHRLPPSPFRSSRGENRSTYSNDDMSSNEGGGGGQQPQLHRGEKTMSESSTLFAPIRLPPVLCLSSFVSISN